MSALQEQLVTLITNHRRFTSEYPIDGSGVALHISTTILVRRLETAIGRCVVSTITFFTESGPTPYPPDRWLYRVLTRCMRAD